MRVSERFQFGERRFPRSPGTQPVPTPPAAKGEAGQERQQRVQPK